MIGFLLSLLAVGALIINVFVVVVLVVAVPPAGLIVAGGTGFLWWALRLHRYGPVVNAARLRRAGFLGCTRCRFASEAHQFFRKGNELGCPKCGAPESSLTTARFVPYTQGKEV